MITFGTDVADLILQRTLYDNTLGLNSSIERMTSGYKVNHAKDNAAGYSIITDLNTQISSMLQVQQNTEDGLSMLQTAEGGLEEIEELLQRLRALATQASNGNYDSKSRDAMQAEADQIIEQIGQIRESMEYNGLNMYYTPREDEAVTTSIGEAAVSRLASAARVSTDLTTDKTNNLNNTTYIQNPAGGGNTSAPAFSYSTSKAANYTPSTSGSSSMKSASSADMPSTQANTIEGAESFNGSETRTVTIDGVEYTIQNRLTTANDLSYTKDTTTGEITFIGNNFTIRGQSDVEHNIAVNGYGNAIYGGNLDDTIIINTGSYDNSVYGGNGNDVITSYSGGILRGEAGNDILNANGGTSQLYGGDGGDTLNINAYCSIVQGGNGDDIFNISYSSGSFYGNDGDDTFNLLHSNPNVTVDGGAGTNIVTGNIGTSTLINVVNANAGTVSLVKGEEKVVNINSIDYTMSTTTATAEVVYRVNDSGQIEFSKTSGDGIIIKGDKNKSHNVYISSGISEFYGGNMGDVINARDGVVVYCGSGNNTITAHNNYIYCGDGNNTISAGFASICGGSGENNVTLSSACYLENGQGTMNLKINGSYNVIYGYGGNNTIVSQSGNYNCIYGFGDADNMSGVVELAAGETKSVVINNISYEINSTVQHSTALLYSINPVTNEIYFSGKNVTIRGQNDVEHNVTIYGMVVKFYGGELNDSIRAACHSGAVYGLGGNDVLISDYATHLYGGDGDDELILNTSAIAYGDAGNDIITINATTSSQINGGDGDDTYNINAKATNIQDTGGNNIYNINTDGASISGGPGNDTFYATGDNNTILGAGGDDYFVVDGDNNTIDGGTGDNYYIVNGSGTNMSNVSRDPNAGGISFTYLGETQTFTLNGKTYTVTNNLNGSNMLQYSLNPNTGVITLNGSGFQIDAASNETAILNIRGDNNTINGSSLTDRITVEQGSNNIINGLGGNDNLTMNSANNSLNGGDGDDTITLNESTNLAVTGGAGGDTITVNSDNNTNIAAGAGDNRITVEGSQNTISADDGNNTITINTDSNNISTGDGDNRFIVNGSSNTVTAGSGANVIGVQGDNNNVTAQNASGTINVYGNENTITNTRGENDVVIQGDGNNYTTTIGNKNVTVTGDDNEVLTGNGNDTLEIRGDNNTIESISGENEFTVRGDGNTIQGGSGIDDVSINGSNNTANGGDSNDSFMISNGNNNTVDGEGGERNTVINNGNNTTFTNAVDITPRPFEVNIKVDIGSGSDKFISTQISFNLFDFSVDFSSQESALESLEDIDSLIKDVQEQLLNIGTTINRLETVLDAQSMKMNNLISTRSTLRDADVAEESSNYIRYQILQQASATLMSTSRGLRAENVLGLLPGGVGVKREG